ncbi:MAG: hypothetical protein QRY74_01650 [Chlamydia sp.]
MRYDDSKEELNIPLHAFLHLRISISHVESQERFIKNLSSYQPLLPNALLSFPLAVGWNENGLFLAVQWDIYPPYTTLWPKYRLGDALEIYIDTKNRNSFRLVHRYCHQFILFPEAFEGIQSKEITEFRTQESRPMAQDNTVKGFFHKAKNGINFFVATIPESALFGWSPEVGGKISLGCVLHNGDGKLSSSQSFPECSGGPASLEKSPYTWITAVLS